MNKRFNPKTEPVLSAVVDKIDATLRCSKFQEYSDLIDVDTWQNIGSTMPQHKFTGESGFGFCNSSYSEYAGVKRLVIVNIENCNRVDSTEDEIAAIVYHELGHLLNYPELPEEPTILYCFEHGVNYNKKVHEEIRANNWIQEEIFADSYVTQHGFGDALISTFYKHIKYFDEKNGPLEIRVEKIKSKELFNGFVRQIDGDDWCIK